MVQLGKASFMETKASFMETLGLKLPGHPTKGHWDTLSHFT